MAPPTVANARYVMMTTAFSDAEAATLTAWIEKQDPKQSKSEAIRNFVLEGLKAAGLG